MNKPITKASKNIPDFIWVPIAMVIFLSIIHFFKAYYWLGWDQYVLVPRSFSGLIGVITSPLLHSNLRHLFSNASSLLIIMMAILFFYKRVAWPAFFLIYLLTGIFVWLTARPNGHIGASGVLFGLISFVLFSGIFRKNVRAMALSFAVLVAFGGIFAGLVPGKEGISWESHLIGFLVGLFTAFIFRSMLEEDEKPRKSPWEDDEQSHSYFISRDAFDKTKEERRRELENEGDSFWSTNNS